MGSQRIGFIRPVKAMICAIFSSMPGCVFDWFSSGPGPRRVLENVKVDLFDGVVCSLPKEILLSSCWCLCLLAYAIHTDIGHQAVVNG